MTLTEMFEKRGKLVADARAALAEITANTDDARATELEARHDTIMAELDKLDKAIAREERTAQAESTLEEFRSRQRPSGRDTEARGQDGERNDAERNQASAAEHREAFLAMVRVGGDLTAIAPEQRAILRAVEQRIQTAGTASAGGYTVPTELAGFIDMAMKDWGPMYDTDVCTVLTTSRGNPITIPTIDDTAKGAVAHTEGGAVTDDGGEDAVFGQATLNAYSFDTEWVRTSFELLQDSDFNVEQLLGGLLGERLGRKANAALTTGTGSSTVMGVVTASSAGKAAASATAIAADELLDLQHSVNAAYRRSPKCRWMFADSTLKAVRKLKDGQGNYLWQLGDVRGSQPDTLLGKPYSINDDMAAIATAAKSVLFGDFGKFYVRKVGSPIVMMARERFAPDYGMLGFMRLDGEIGQSGAIKHLVQA